MISVFADETMLRYPPGTRVNPGPHGDLTDPGLSATRIVAGGLAIIDPMTVRSTASGPRLASWRLENSHMTQLGVVGGGTMGAGIAGVAARAGDQVLILERDQETADATCPDRASLARGVQRGKLSEEDADAALARLTTTTTVGDFRTGNWSSDAPGDREPEGVVLRGPGQGHP